MAEQIKEYEKRKAEGEELQQEKPTPIPVEKLHENDTLITDFDFIYSSKAKYGISSYEWGICRYKKDGEREANYAAYIYMGGAYGLTDRVENNKIIWEKCSIICEENDDKLYFVDNQEFIQTYLNIELDSNYNVTYAMIESDDSDDEYADMSTYKSTGSLKGIPGFEFKTGTQHIPRPTASPTPTAKPTPSAKPTVSPSATAAPQNTQEQFDKFISELNVAELAQKMRGAKILMEEGGCRRSLLGLPYQGCKIGADESDINKFMTDIVSLFKNMKTVSKEQSKYYTMSNQNSKCYAMLHVENNYLGIDICDNECVLKIDGKTFYGTVSNPHDIVHYIYKKDYLLTGIEETAAVRVGSSIDLDAKLYGKGVPYTEYERLTFDIAPDDTYYETIFDTISEPGKTVHCVFDTVSAGGNMHICRFEGSKGSFITFKQIDNIYRIGINSELILDPEAHYIKNNKMYTDGNPDAFYELRFNASVSGNSVTGVTMSLTDPYTQKNMANAIKASNVRYECFESAIQDKNTAISMVNLFDLPDKETVMKEYAEKGYITHELRRTDSEDNAFYDVYIDFTAEAPFEMKNPPEWYKNLGDNVTVTIAGLNKTRNGKVIQSYPQLRFKGSKGELWFCGGDEQENTDTVFKLYSTVSIDGFTVVKKQEEHDNISVTFNLTADGEIETVVFESELGTAVTAMENMNCKGGRKAYEKWW